MTSPADDDHVGALVTACNARGFFLHLGFEGTSDPPARSQILRRDVPYWIAGPTGAPQARLGRHPGFERWYARSPSGGGGFTLGPLGRASVIALGEPRAHIGTADSFHISVLALDGSPIGAIGNALQPRARTPADIEHCKLLDTIGLSAQRVATEQAYWKVMEFSRTMPADTAFVVDSAQNLWVRSQALPGAWQVDWYVFGPDGQGLSRVSLPSSFQVVALTRLKRPLEAPIKCL